MKTLQFIAVILLVSCSRKTEKPLSAAITQFPGDKSSFLSLASNKPMYNQLSRQLELSTITQVTGIENVQTFMVAYKGEPNKIYALDTKGNELLYTSKMIDDRNGSIGLLKNGEALVIEFVDGVRHVKNISGEQFDVRYTTDFHGGSGFCQRIKGETFAACFRAESDEFCDSFISCLALSTQPSVAVVIGLACSCNA